MTNQLWYGDNLGILREHVPTHSVDLVYLDPPFNSNRSYNVLFKSKTGDDAMAQIEAFDDTWTWSHESEEAYRELVSGAAPIRVADALQAMRNLVGDNDVLAYLVMMTARLIELHRVLKSTGSLYLHCDPTASHYLKIILDAIFRPENFRNEIIWKRTASKGLTTKRLPSNHDVILSYQRSATSVWNADSIFTPYDHTSLDPKTLGKYRHLDPDGRRYRLASLINPNPDRPNLEYEFLGVTRVWRWERERMQRAHDEGLVVQSGPGRVPEQKLYLDEQRGKPLSDVWTDISPLNSRAAERLGYPTQKPVALVERILQHATNEGDVVLDPFCGCGTTIDAPQRMFRRWVGIDITYLSIDLIRKRLKNTYGEEIAATYKVHGVPEDAVGAQAMFEENPFEFERWAVSLVDGQPNEKQVGDRGIDGQIRFPVDQNMNLGRVIVSVKGGTSLNPSMVRDLVGTVKTLNAEMGLLLTLKPPTKGMKEAARNAGGYQWPVSGKVYPKIQIVTIAELFGGRRVEMPTPLLPYVKAPGFAGYQGNLFAPQF